MKIGPTGRDGMVRVPDDTPLDRSIYIRTNAVINHTLTASTVMRLNILKVVRTLARPILKSCDLIVGGW